MVDATTPPQQTFRIPARLLGIKESGDRTGKGAPGVGVWSPFGEVFHPHGEVQLSLSRKPLQHEALAPMAVAASTVGFRRTNALGGTSSKQQGKPNFPNPPMLQRGLGLGLGLHPQRFPRSLLRSSEQRLTSCHAGHESAYMLTGSRSEPLLSHRVRYEADFIPSPRSTLEEDQEIDSIAESGDEEDGDDSRVPASTAPVPLDAVLPQLPIGKRAAVEFKSVQRRTRLHLQETLEERGRLRSAIFALRHAQVGLAPLLLDRQRPSRFTLRDPTTSQLSSTCGASQSGGGEAPDGKTKLGSSVATPQGGGAERGVERAVRDGGGGTLAATRSSTSRLSAIDGATLWHNMSGELAEFDGGGLRLWSEVLEVWEKRPPRPTYDEGKRAIELSLARTFFAQLRSTIESNPTEPYRADQLEALFRSHSQAMLDTHGRLPAGHARELLMPLLRAVGTHVGVEVEEIRRLQLAYAYPPRSNGESGSPGGSPSSRRSPGRHRLSELTAGNGSPHAPSGVAGGSPNGSSPVSSVLSIVHVGQQATGAGSPPDALLDEAVDRPIDAARSDAREAERTAAADLTSVEGLVFIEPARPTHRRLDPSARGSKKMLSVPPGASYTAASTAASSSPKIVTSPTGHPRGKRVAAAKATTAGKSIIHDSSHESTDGPKRRARFANPFSPPAAAAATALDADHDADCVA